MRLGFLVLVVVGVVACDQLNKPMTSPGPMAPIGAPPPPSSAPAADAGPVDPDAPPTLQPGDVQL